MASDAPTWLLLSEGLGADDMKNLARARESFMRN
jgi:hypothetical protein